MATVERNKTAFAEWLECQRIALDINKSEQAERIGIRLSELSKIASGDRKITVSLLERIAFAFHLSKKQKRAMYIASLPIEVFRIADDMAAGDADIEDIAIFIKYGIRL